MATRISIPSLDLSLNSDQLSARSKLVSTLLSSSPNSEEIPLELPPWVSKSLFLSYITHVETDRLQDGESEELARLAAFMQDERLEKVLVEHGTLDAFTVENIVARYELAEENKGKSDIWRRFYTKALQYAVNQLNHIVEVAKERLTPESLENLVLEALGSDFETGKKDLEPAINTLQGLWKTPTVSHLLEKIEKHAISNPPKIPSFTWNLSLNSSSKYHNSPVFEVDGVACQLQLWYFSPDDRIDCYLTPSPSELTRQVSTLAAFTVSISLSNEEFVRETRLVMLVLGSKGYKLVRRVYGVKARSDVNLMKVGVNIRLERVYSRVFEYLVGNFARISHNGGAGRLDGDRLIQLFSLPQLNISSEQSVLDVLGHWAERHKLSPDFPQQLGCLLDQVRWRYVSTRDLVDCGRMYPALKSSIVFIKAVNRQFAERSGLLSSPYLPPRPSYKTHPSHESAITFSSFIGELITIVMDMDFTPTVPPSNRTEIDHFRAILEGKNRHIRDLHRSLTVIEQIYSQSQSQYHSPIKAVSDPKQDLNGRSTTHSLAALRSNRPTIVEVSVEESDVEGKVMGLLKTLWTKVEEKTVSPRSSAG